MQKGGKRNGAHIYNDNYFTRDNDYKNSVRVYTLVYCNTSINSNSYLCNI